jgi:hypothetical protein
LKEFSEIYKQLLPELETVEEFRKAKLKSSKKFLTIGIVGLATCAIVSAIVAEWIPLIPGAIIMIVGLVGYFGGVKAYKNEFKSRVITPFIKVINPTLSYQAKGHISKQQFKESKIFSESPDRFSGEDYIAGKIDKTEVEFSELNAQYRTTDSKGRSQYHTFFRGLFLIADFHKHFKGRTMVLPDTSEKMLGFIGKKLQKLNFGRDQLVYMEDPEFEKEFVVYGTDQIESRYILSVSMIQRILDLKKKAGCKIYLSFLNSNVYLAVYWSKNILEPNIRESATNSETLNKFYRELSFCFGIIDDLNLNTRIWSKQEVV